MTLPAFVEHFPYAGLSALLILGALGFPFPEDTTLVLSGVLIASGVVKPLITLSVVYVSLLTADFTLYSFGRKYGRMVVTHKRFSKIITPERLSVLEEKFNRRGAVVILVGRHLVGLRAQIFLVAGIMRMSPVKFLFADAISSIFTIAVMVGAGYAGGNSIEVLRRDMSRIEHIGILAGLVVLAGFVILRFLKYRRQPGQ
ncbi:MAG: DedA family protein [Nitrospirota bacterium]|jgi:membrane protein DedA with SNARE-associated domain